MTPQTALEQVLPSSDASEDTQALLREIRDNTAAHASAARRQLLLSRINTLLLTVMTVAVLVFVGVLMPRISVTLNNANRVLADMETVTKELTEADLAGILRNVNQLVLQGEESLAQALTDVQEALEMIQQLDIATLNEAIQGLYDVVHPLSSLFGR